jgi:hypothetical protein
MRTQHTWQSVIATWVVTLAVAGTAVAQTAGRAKPKMATEIPPEITTPDRVETRLGTLKFFDGMPDKDTVQKVYDNLDFLRGVEVFLNTMPGASLVAMRHGLREVGAADGNVAIFETLMDSKSLWLTPNTETVYAASWIDLKHGPIVVESPPNTLGIADDFWFRYITDLGNAGPDQGKGGKFLFLPPGYTGDVPAGYFVARSSTFGVWFATRGFLVNGDPEPAVENFKKHLRIYPLAKAANPPTTKFFNASGNAHNTIHANDYRFYEEVNQIVQEEPTEAIDPETLGLLASIGIEKGKPFAPDARMKKILTEAAAVGNATARAIAFRPRDERVYLFPGNRTWYVPTIGGHEFVRDGARMLDARTMMFYTATGVTPAMFAKMVGRGSQYAFATADATGHDLDGAKTYKLTIPANPPVNDFWSVVLYDTQTRSELQTDQQFPSIGSQKQGIQKNADGSVDVWFAPKAPAGKESNWIQTVPGKSWWIILRLYGPLEPWFDRTWRPGEINEVTR